MIKSMRDISQNVIKALNDNSKKIINILTSIKVNINNPMSNNNITYNNWCDKKGQDIDANEKKSIFLSNINRNNSSSNGNKNINFRQINSSNYSIPKRNTLKKIRINYITLQKRKKLFIIFIIIITFSLNQKEQKKTYLEIIPFCLNTQLLFPKRKRIIQFKAKKNK